MASKRKLGHDKPLADQVEDYLNGTVQISDADDLSSDEDYPVLNLSDSDGDDSFDDDDEEDDEAALLRELAEEEALERELAQDESSDDDIDPQDPDPLSTLIQRAITKPDEKDHDLPAKQDHSELLGFDARSYAQKSRQQISDATGDAMTVWDPIEMQWDTDDEGGPDDGPNRVGKIPAHFYDGMPHIGYDMDGKKIMRPLKGDELDKFLKSVDDPTTWTSVEDKKMQKSVQLTDQELDMIGRIARAENPDAEFDPYEPTVEWFTGKGKEMQMPLTSAPEPKRRFIPSKWEHKKVMKIVRAIRQGRIVQKPKKEDKPQYYAIWSNSDTPRDANHPMYMPAPKLALPGHGESYNPPAEYLFNDQEKAEWEAQDPSDRKVDVMPKKFPNLRTVPAWDGFVKSRFDRCLDLYLAPRTKKRKPKILEGVTAPEDLLPKLPSPAELRPFPIIETAKYLVDVEEGQERSKMRCVDIDKSGNWVATGDEDGIVRVWECRRAKQIASWKLGEKEDNGISSVKWCPIESGALLLAVSTGSKIFLLSPIDLLSPSQATRVRSVVSNGFTIEKTSENAPISGVSWARPSDDLQDLGVMLEVTVGSAVETRITDLNWHGKGDYLVSTSPSAGARAVLLHQISKHQTQAPFSRTKFDVQCVCFHPTKPQLFVATKRNVRIYDLVQQQLVKALQPGVRWISSIDVHPLGDNVIVGSYDRKVVWHDLDLSDRPYKTLRNHPRAVRSVGFSPAYPLFASASDDGTIQIFHATVYSDLLTNPMIVPCKVLKGHQIKDGLGVLGMVWHPKEPWAISIGADGTGRLWCC